MPRSSDSDTSERMADRVIIRIWTPKIFGLVCSTDALPHCTQRNDIRDDGFHKHAGSCVGSFEEFGYNNSL